MKQFYRKILLQAGLSTLISAAAWSQAYEPLTVSTGFTADVIANGTGSASSSTTIAVDDPGTTGTTGYAYLSKDLMVPGQTSALTYGLPTNRILGSVVSATQGMQFNLANYTGNNSLRLAATNDTGTLVFTNTLASKKLYLAATSGSGSSTVTVRVIFTDGTFEDHTNISIEDWYWGADYIIAGIGRVDRASSVLEQSTDNPRIYQIGIDISIANQSINWFKK